MKVKNQYHLSFIFETQIKRFELNLRGFCPSIESPRKQNFNFLLT